MSSYSYVAVDPHGLETRGTLDVTDQSEALRRIREMGLFPTRVLAAAVGRRVNAGSFARSRAARTRVSIAMPRLGKRVKPARLTIFTRQLATLVEAGMPLVRSLRVLQEQEENPTLKRVIADLCEAIESGSSLAEAVKAHPRVFNRLYVNMVLAGEIGGALEITLQRLAEFMEKAQRIKGKIKAALVYPCAVLAVATGILVLMMTFIVPRFKMVFADLLEGRSLPTFTSFVFKVSEMLTHHLPYVLAGVAAVGVFFTMALQTVWGRWTVDQLKLALPVFGPLFRKASVSRFARTLGTLASNGVPILQALTIVKETAGNLVVSRVIGQVHDGVKQGEPIAPTLKESGVFPAMVAGMVDVGEQTGALPEMLLKVADNYDNEVDNAASALASLLEPVMIVILAIIVGGIVIAMFLPLITIYGGGFDKPGTAGGD